MTPGVAGAFRLSFRLAFLVAAPVVLWLGSGLAARMASHRDPRFTEVRLRHESRQLQTAFQRLLEEAADLTETALRHTPSLAVRAARAGAWRERLEGVGIIGAEGRFLDWDGTPSEPPAPGEQPATTSWTVYVEGQRVRLVVTTAPREDRSFALASFILDSLLGDLAFQQLLPRSLSRSHIQDIEFLDARGTHEDVREFFGTGEGVFREGDPLTYYIPMRSPSGEILALATFHEIPAAHRAARIGALGGAVAALVFAVLLWALFDWASLCGSPRGLLLGGAALVLGRGALLVARAPVHLLPRELGSPSLFGTSEALGLLTSPADFLLTTLALLLGALALRRFCAAYAVRRRALAVVLSVAGCAALLGILVVLSVSLARHARIAPNLFENTSQLMAQAFLLSGLTLAMLAAAELGAVIWPVLSRRPGASTAYWPGRIAVGLALLPLAAISSSAFLFTSDRLARERLRSEFAPQVLEQSPRRALALRAAVHDAAE